jgi:predicted permease
VAHFTKGSGDPGLRDLWVPIGQAGIDLDGEGNAFEVLARLIPGVTLEQARGEALAALPEETGPPDREVRMAPRKEVVTQGLGTPLLLLLGAAGILLLIACTNVATLIMGEATGRRREMATRSALGAGSFRVTRQLLTESVILGLMGSGFGILLSLVGTDALLSLAPPIPRLEEVEVSGRVLLFAIGVGITTGLLFGLAPLVPMARDSVKEGLMGKDRPTSRSAHRSQAAVVGFQIALTVVLLVAAGLFARSLVNLHSVHPGFDSDDLASLYIAVNEARYPTQSEVNRFFDEVIRELEAVRGVVSVAGATGLPFPGGGPKNVLEIPGRGPERGVPVRRKTILPKYHETLGIPILAGRRFSTADGTDDPKVMIISESMAKRHQTSGGQASLPASW